MKVVCISDTHGAHARLTIPEADLLIHAGDLAMDGRIEEARSTAQWFGSQPARTRVAIPGNHDFCIEKAPEAARAMFAEYGARLLIDEAMEVDGWKLYGTPWQPWFFDWAYNLPRDKDAARVFAEQVWGRIPADTDILVVHGPPRGIGDTVVHPAGKQVGCEVLRRRIEEIRPKLVVCGHIHEGRGVDRTSIPGVIVANVSSLDRSYRVVQPPMVFDIERSAVRSAATLNR